MTLEIAVVVVALAALAAVIHEIVDHDPGLLLEITTDVRAMARTEEGSTPAAGQGTIGTRHTARI